MADVKSLNMGQLSTTGMASTRKMTDTEENMNNNNVNEQDTDVFTCLVCSMCFYNKLELMKHLSKIHRLTNLCRICYFDLQKIERFANPVSLRNHNLKCHSDKMVKCVCGSMLINSKMLMSHLKKFKCDVSTTGANKNRMVRCVCGKRFSSQDQIVHHQSKCRKRWHCSDSFTESTTTSSAVTDCPGRRTRAQTKVKVSSRPGSLSELSENVDTYHDTCHPHHTLTRSGRKSKHTTYIENFPCGKDVGRIDETFRKAVVSSLYETTLCDVNVNISTLPRTGLEVNGNTDGHQTSTRPTVTPDKVEHCSAWDNNKELDLRTTFVKNRNNDDSSMHGISENCLKNIDMNNNVPCVSPVTMVTGNLSRDVANGDVADGNHTVDKLTAQNFSNYDEQKDGNNNNVSQTKETYNYNSVTGTMETNSNLLVSGVTLVSSKTEISNIKSDKTKIVKRKRGRDVRAMCFGRRKFACKFCGHLYMKLFLYSHQRMMHSKTTWRIVPLPTTLTQPAGKYKYRCYWCCFVSIHWTNAVKHHYKHHQGRELNILCLSSS